MLVHFTRVAKLLPPKKAVKIVTGWAGQGRLFFAKILLGRRTYVNLSLCVLVQSAVVTHIMRRATHSIRLSSLPSSRQILQEATYGPHHCTSERPAQKPSLSKHISAPSICIEHFGGNSSSLHRSLSFVHSFAFSNVTERIWVTDMTRIIHGCFSRKQERTVFLVLLLVASLTRTTSLMPGRFQVNVSPARGFVRYSDADDTGSKDNSGPIQREDYTTTMSDGSSRAWNASRRICNMTSKRRAVQSSITFETKEEKERRQLDWLVRSSEKILGPKSPEIGDMEREYVELTYDLMGAWSRRASKREGSKAPHVVERLLQRLIQEQDSGNDLVVIDTMVYNLVLEAWSNSSEEGSAERSEEILRRMERMYLEDDNSQVKPNEDSYNAVIKTFVKNGNRSIAASKAESLVRLMESQAEFIGVSPTRRSYNLLLYALANSNLENASKHADEILHKMMDRYVEHGEKKCKPDINSYNQVLTAWARGKTPGFEENMQSVYEELLNLPKDMRIIPNTDSFNAVMGGWLKSNKHGSLPVIQSILTTMEQSYAGGNDSAKPDRISINTHTAAHTKYGSPDAVEKSMARATELEEKYQIASSTVSYNIVVDSWCKSGRSDAPDRVLELLASMENEFKSGRSGVRPDGYTYSSVVGCFVKFKRQNAAEVAEDLLGRMNDLYVNHDGEAPTTSVYNAVINAWASKTKSEKALQKVMDFVQIMDANDGKDPSVPEPNRITYNTVIKAMRDGNVESAKMAEKILTKLETKGQSNAKMLPDSYSYTSVITAYGRSDAQNKASKALQILERLNRARESGNMAAITTTHSFNAALNACAFVVGNKEKKTEAFEIAIKIYGMLKEQSVADHTTYGTLLRIFATLLDPTDSRREALVDEIFRKASSTGNVGRLVITQLKFAASADQFLQLTGREVGGRLNVKDLPKAWTRNVRETIRRP